jgi:hypothetical protein
MSTNFKTIRLQHVWLLHILENRPLRLTHDNRMATNIGMTAHQQAKTAACAAVIRGSTISAKFGGGATNLAEVALRRMTARAYVK